MMKIALVYNDYEGISGETVFFRNMVRAMSEQGFDIESFPIRQPHPGTPAGWISHYSRFPLLLDVNAALRRCEGRLIHFLNAALSPAARGMKARKIATSHFFLESYLDSTPAQNPLRTAAEKAYAAYSAFLDRSAFRSLDRLVASSMFEGEAIGKRYGLDGRKITTIFPGIDVGYFRRMKRKDLHSQFGCEETVLFTGRLQERSKGLADLIRAVGIMGRPGLKLLIVGDGPDMGMYQRLVRAEGLDGKAVFLGRLGFDEKSAMQASADVAAVPSRYEVYGTVFAEAVACRTPVVAYDLPFWKGLYEGAGLFVPPRGPAALAQGISRVLDDKKLRKTLSEGAERIAPAHDFRNTVDSYIKLYDEVSG